MSKKGYIDLHNHLFPPIDDGPETIEETLLSLNEFIECGFDEIVFTPHMNPSSQKEIHPSEEMYGEIKKIPLKFHFSCEYLLEPGILKVIDDGRIKTISQSSNFFLVEMWIPFVDEALKIFMEKCLSKNYIPIIAHPERNQPIERIRKMKEIGYKIQLNIGSLFGLYGNEIKRNAFALLENGLVDCMATDAHDYGFSKQMRGYMEKLAKEIGESELERLMIEFPRKIIG